MVYKFSTYLLSILQFVSITVGKIKITDYHHWRTHFNISPQIMMQLDRDKNEFRFIPQVNL